ncbi:hypothetical protein D8674_039167 [Pyrus ussuriensis x Pyrus communis]|uniref:Uncharacterized protein n=1 Tax=Pyrus ussuriensis x Pyrus communis TaxID=2448454 RepID=A0A5N5I7Q1_9ROSA|nr:hypothetical protein D8674_039205 [Pyrus ussuriensis x Pyrus communis]KAB2634551.1 hypothetical protein D8674_039167 [Pyrus ussuriensis x Pyrus communis]
MPSGPYDMSQYVEFAYLVDATMRTNCSNAEWRSWKYVPENAKKAHHYELTSLDGNQNQYINDLCIGRFTQWKSDLHKHYEKYDGPEVALAVGCLIDLCGHFQDEKYLKKVKANSINQLKKKLLHCSSSRCFSYRLEERRGSKFHEIDMFKEVYIRDELTEQLYSTMVEKGQTVIEEVAYQLLLETPIKEVFPLRDADFQIMIDILDQTLGHKNGNVHRGLGKARLQDPSASSSRQRTKEVQSLTSKVVDLKEQIAVQ